MASPLGQIGGAPHAPAGLRPAAPLRWGEMARPIVALAPMDGITDSAYRQVVRCIDPGVVLFSEFTSVEGFLRSGRVRRRLDFKPEEHPYFVQLFGSDPEAFAEATRALEQQGVMGIDINMGCPSKKIVHSQHGSGLMRDVGAACRIVERVAALGRLETSVKTRLGWQDSSGLIAFAKSLESAGASLITIHGRTYGQRFSGMADWAPIYRLKEALSVPVLGNGDVRSRSDGQAKLGNLDGFMIGRAAIGNPWAFVARGPGGSPAWREKAAVIATHYRLLREIKPERIALLEFRKHVAEYVRGFDDAKAVRWEIMSAPDDATLLRRVEALAWLDDALPRAS